MKVKLSQIVSSQEGLIKLMTEKLPINISYSLTKLAFKVEAELKIYNDHRNKLIKSLGEQTNAETDEWSVKPENLVEFRKQEKELQDIEVDLNFAEGKDFEKIKISDLEEVKIDANSLLALDWLLEA